MSKLKVLDLFSGIGGFSLGLERAGGFETVAFCEIEPFPRRVLAKHWPKVPIYEDVRTLTADTLARDGIAVDVICGGFPCQDISFAGKRAGLEGARSGLWVEYARLIGELRPRFVIVENVPGLLSLGMADVLGDLASLGYDATWDCIPASAVGAPHRRDRVWIVAYAGSEQHKGSSLAKRGKKPKKFPASDTTPLQRSSIERSEPHGNYERAEVMANTNVSGPQGRNSRKLSECAREWTARTSSPSVADTACQLPHGSGARAEQDRKREPSNASWWGTEPDLGRVAHGVPARVDRLKCLGNAVVPQIPELIGKAIMQAEGMTT